MSAHSSSAWPPVVGSRAERSMPAAPVRGMRLIARRPRRRACSASTRRWSGSTVALLALGLVMVYSASVALPDNPKFARYTPTYFLMRHACFMAIALVAALLAFQVPVAIWEKLAPWLFVASLLLLVRGAGAAASARASTARGAGSRWAS